MYKFIITILLFSPSFAYAGAVLPDWPDFVVCTQSGNPNVFYFSYHPYGGHYYYQEAGQAYVRYDASGNHVSNDTGVGCSTDSIAARLLAGTAGNFGGTDGGSGTTTESSADTTHEVVFYGFILFFLALWFPVWYFRGKAI